MRSAESYKADLNRCMEMLQKAWTEKAELEAKMRTREEEALKKQAKDNASLRKALDEIAKLRERIAELEHPANTPPPPVEKK